MSAAPACSGTVRPPSAGDGFELLLFTALPQVAAAAHAAGIDGVVIDLEYRDKEARQFGADTEVNRHTPADVRACRAATAGHLIVRINAVGEWTSTEVDAVLDAGADEILVPMVTDPAQVESVMGQVGPRARVGALVETPEAVASAGAIASLGLSRIYLGLNDLAIARKTPNLFTALLDGTADRVARQVVAAGVSFGLGGLTLPGHGAPVPSTLLAGEMARLGCSHVFLRRSFLRDVPISDFESAAVRIHAAMRTARRRTPAQEAADRAALVESVSSWVAGARPTHA